MQDLQELLKLFELTIQLVNLINYLLNASVLYRNKFIRPSTTKPLQDVIEEAHVSIVFLRVRSMLSSTFLWCRGSYDVMIGYDIGALRIFRTSSRSIFCLWLIQMCYIRFSLNPSREKYVTLCTERSSNHHV